MRSCWRQIKFGLAVLMVLMTVPAYAVQVTDIYQALVPVADQSERARNKGVVTGLSQVLVKMTGDSHVLTRPQVRSALSKAQSYVTEIGYTRITVPGEDQPVLALSVSYSEREINRFLRSEQLPIWPASRPSLLVWLITDTVGVGKQHMGPELFPNVVINLERHMSRRSAPLMMPLLDLQDRLTLPADAAWQFNQKQLQAAAQRYDVQHWLVVRFYQTSAGQWRGSSWLNSNGKTELQNFTTDLMDDLVGQAVDRAVNRLSAQYVFTPKLVAESVSLTLENVTSYQAFNEAIAYFKDLELVRQVRVASVDQDQLELTLDVDGEIQILLEALQRNRRLHEVTTDSPNPVLVDHHYRFRWSN